MQNARGSFGEAVAWRLLEMEPMRGDSRKRFEVMLRYENGVVRRLAATFHSREQAEKYLERFHAPIFANEETAASP
jgi:hypothetical protein